MKNIAAVRETFCNAPIGSTFTTAEIKHMVSTKYGCNKSSIIPSDYSYNMTNKGKTGSLKDFNIFVQIKRGLYQYVGENYKP